MSDIKEIIKNLNLNGKVIMGARLVNCFLEGTGNDRPASANALAALTTIATALAARVAELEANALTNIGDVDTLPAIASTDVNSICKLSTDSKRYILAEHERYNITVGKNHIYHKYYHGTDKTVDEVVYTGWAYNGTTSIYTLASEPGAGDDVYVYDDEEMVVDSSYTITDARDTDIVWEEL